MEARVTSGFTRNPRVTGILAGRDARGSAQLEDALASVPVKQGPNQTEGIGAPTKHKKG